MTCLEIWSKKQRNYSEKQGTEQRQKRDIPISHKDRMANSHLTLQNGNDFKEHIPKWEQQLGNFL